MRLRPLVLLSTAAPLTCTMSSANLNKTESNAPTSSADLNETEVNVADGNADLNETEANAPAGNADLNKMEVNALTSVRSGVRDLTASWSVVSGVRTILLVMRRGCRQTWSHSCLKK